MTENTYEKHLAEIERLMRELLVWAKVQGAPIVKEILLQMSNQERLAYDLADGVNTQAEIAKRVGVTQATISNWWKRWAALGLTSESETYSGRQRHNFSLSELGISKASTDNRSQGQGAEIAGTQV